jgi:hypothetical protein
MEVIVSPEGTSELKEHKDKDQLSGHQYICSQG